MTGRVCRRKCRTCGGALFVPDVLLGVVAALIVAWFSRQREFRADAGASRLMGRKQPMIDAVVRLGGLNAGEMLAPFCTHPPMEQRIERLRQAA